MMYSASLGCPVKYLTAGFLRPSVSSKTTAEMPFSFMKSMSLSFLCL